MANLLFKKPLDASYQLVDMADDTLALMDALEISKAHIVGASMGGMIAQLVAIRAPDRVHSLTSIMSTTGDRRLPKPSLSFISKVLRPPPKNRQDIIPYGLDLWRTLHGSTYEFEQSKVSELLSLALSRGFNPKGNMRQLAAILDAENRTKALQTLRLPSLVLHGEVDPLVPVECGRATADAIQGAKLKTYPGMGHTLPEALYPDIVESIIQLARVSN